MGRKGKYSFIIIVVIAICASAGFSQVVTGVPPFQSFAGGPDVINLGNLNVHYSIPVFSRAGRGAPFSYALAYDSSVWTPSGSAWIPASATWGLHRDVPALTGYVSYSVYQLYCHLYGYYYNKYIFRNYVDPQGTRHGTLAVVYDDNCGTTLPGTATVITNDGSGITAYVDSGPTASITLKNGTSITPPLVPFGTVPSGTGNSTDSNGNKITTSTASGTTSFYDTLSSTTPVLACLIHQN